MTNPSLRAIAETAKAWPFQEARLVRDRLEKKPPEKGYALFQTGYGPSGLPHIGTFGEVLRTSMVKNAFEILCDIPTKLLTFSDDMDGMRKIPSNVPKQELLQQYIDFPLSKVPDPFGTDDSFAAHNNNQLKGFLNQYGFDYEFASSSEYYHSGRFDEGLLRILECYDDIQKIMLPSLREERAQSYSPFLPIDEESGRVLQVPIIAHDVKKGTITYQRDDGQEIETPVTGGHVKLQWKPDWGMRWFVLGVDYEMSGKDLLDSVRLSSRICRVMGAPPPEGFTYELFLDQEGDKISKSKGNGLSMEDWLRYAPDESLALFMYQKPKTAKRLYFDVIPKQVDEYQSHVQNFHKQSPEQQIENPAFHIHNGKINESTTSPVSFALLLNLVSASNAKDKELLWGFIQNYEPDLTPQSHPYLDHLVGYAINYYEDFILPNKNYATPTETEKVLLETLRQRLIDLPKESHNDGEAIQTVIYEIGKENYDNLRDWFTMQYRVLLGQDQGPRIGSFYALYGIENTISLIDEAINRA